MRHVSLNAPVAFAEDVFAAVDADDAVLERDFPLVLDSLNLSREGGSTARVN